MHFQRRLKLSVLATASVQRKEHYIRALAQFDDPGANDTAAGILSGIAHCL